MKLLLSLSFSVCILFSSNLLAQTYGDADEFSYDGAGNRVKREYKYTVIAPKPGTTQNEQIDSFSQRISVDHLSIEVYPNPTTDDLIFDNKNWHPEDKVTIALYDIAGKQVIIKNIIQAKETVSLKELVPGSYIANYYMNEKLLTNWTIIKY